MVLSGGAVGAEWWCQEVLSGGARGQLASLTLTTFQTKVASDGACTETSMNELVRSQVPSDYIEHKAKTESLRKVHLQAHNRQHPQRFGTQKYSTATQKYSGATMVSDQILILMIHNK